ncbi:hypothetical protein M2150_001792 [Lachnospiraceae bacterium PM6-15]|uniref:hypothetical protein n=1 Tax=Ohessyouella blattaphilus TaxID=2949333 RepID=UPI003E2AC2B4
MDWNKIWNDVISKIVWLLVGGAGGWIVGLFKGKKESSTAIERKDKIYQPLIDEIKRYSKFDWSVRENIKVHVLREIATESYKFGLPDEVQNKCDDLYSMVSEYNSIDPIKVADSIIVDIFTKGYEEIYGSIIDGISYHSDRDGNEWEEEEIAEPVQMIEHINNTKDIESLLLNEGMYSDEVLIDEENALSVLIYLQLKRIYSSALYVVINGERYKLPEPVIELKVSPEEYMAYRYDFFDIYNNSKKIKRKYELREEIIYCSQALIEELKEIIGKIVRVYEVEEI